MFLVELTAASFFDLISEQRDQNAAVSAFLFNIFFVSFVHKIPAFLDLTEMSECFLSLAYLKYVH